MVTGNGRNNYTIVCHNYKKLTSRYVFSEENEIEIENIKGKLILIGADDDNLWEAGKYVRHCR